MSIRFISGFLKPSCILKIGFQNSFITTAAAFQHGFRPIRASKNLGKPQKIYEKNYPKI
jgi:hypothetical protein